MVIIVMVMNNYLFASVNNIVTTGVGRASSRSHSRLSCLTAKFYYYPGLGSKPKTRFK